jgi:tRNA uridine 5-carboxymethylaminomethyl modification enzyme
MQQKGQLLAALQGGKHAAWLRKPESRIDDLLPWVREVLGDEPMFGLLMSVETEVKYAGYIRQQGTQIERMRSSSSRPIPGEISYSGIPGLSLEVQNKLERVRPATLGQAARIPGITPAALAVLGVYLAGSQQRL